MHNGFHESGKDQELWPVLAWEEATTRALTHWLPTDEKPPEFAYTPDRYPPPMHTISEMSEKGFQAIKEISIFDLPPAAILCFYASSQFGFYIIRASNTEVTLWRGFGGTGLQIANQYAPDAFTTITIGGKQRPKMLKQGFLATNHAGCTTKVRLPYFKTEDDSPNGKTMPPKKMWQDSILYMYIKN
ncbi:MAG: hypothetical protein WAU07_03945 [Microgenomates group bacterium]